MSDCLRLISPLVGGMVNLGVQIFVHRATGRLIPSVGAGLIAGGIVTPAVYVFFFGREFATRPSEATFLFFGVMAIYLAGSYMCFQIINTGEASIRFRILREMRGFGRPVTRAELAGRYNDNTLLRARLARLVGNGQVQRQGERYVLVPGQPMERIAAIVLALKRFLVRRESEFDLPVAEPIDRDPGS